MATAATAAAAATAGAGASAPAAAAKRRCFLFDVDGTLTAPRKVRRVHAACRAATSPVASARARTAQKADAATLAFLRELHGLGIVTGMVGGSDLHKQKEQLGDDVLSLFTWTFPENGLIAYRDGALISSTVSAAAPCRDRGLAAPRVSRSSRRVRSPCASGWARSG